MKTYISDREIISGQEVQREHMRRSISLTDTEGMTITEENFKRLRFDIKKCRPAKGGIGVYLDDTLYEDFAHFVSALMNKYFTKEEL